MQKAINGRYIAFEFGLLNESEYVYCESGIMKKIYLQYNTFVNNDFHMQFYNPYEEKNILTRRIRRRLPWFCFTKWGKCPKKNDTIDFEYIRKPWRLDGDLIFYLKRMKKKNPDCKIVMEIPTYPYDKESYTISSLPLVIKDKFWRRFLYKYVDRVVTYSEDDYIFNIPTIKISNAIDTSMVKAVDKIEFDSNNIHVMLCATLCYWHGYDRELYGLYEYYKKNGNTNFVLHIVGDGDEYLNYKNIIDTLDLRDHVIMYGKKFGKELDDIYNLCDVAFDSMGRHRSGVYYNSSLKGKEYLAKGLPIVSGVSTELDSESQFSCYYRIPADDSPVDFEKIKEFCCSVYSSNNVKEVRSNIVDFANTRFSYTSTMKPVTEYVKN